MKYSYFTLDNLIHILWQFHHWTPNWLHQWIIDLTDRLQQFFVDVPSAKKNIVKWTRPIVWSISFVSDNQTWTRASHIVHAYENRQSGSDGDYHGMSASALANKMKYSNSYSLTFTFFSHRICRRCWYRTYTKRRWLASVAELVDSTCITHAFAHRHAMCDDVRLTELVKSGNKS